MSSNGPLSGRTCVVTGATSGIGIVTARELARSGGTVLLVGREAKRTSEAVSWVGAAVGHADVRGFSADLRLQGEVRRLAREISELHPRIHVIVNNAGAIFSKRSLTAEGFESTWALNVVSPFLLTQLLLPRLRAAAPSRVVNVASAAHRGVRLDFGNLQGERRYSAYGAYGRSKLGLVLLTYEFARRMNAAHVTFNALHPGFVASRFGQNNPGGTGAAIHVLAVLFGIRPERGARTSIFLATDPSVAEVTGKYFARGHEVASSSASYDIDAGSRLWDVVSLQVGIPPDVLAKPL